jgi:uncharacterized Zn ribbon protein
MSNRDVCAICEENYVAQDDARCGICEECQRVCPEEERRAPGIDLMEALKRALQSGDHLNSKSSK